MRNVLILGGRAPVALDHSRRFAAQGWRVHVGDSVSCRISGASRTASATVRLPSPRFHGPAFSSALRSYVQEHDIELVVPTCEEVFFLSRFRSALPAQLTVAVDEFDKLRLLHSKLTFIDQAQDCGAGVPTTQRVRTIHEAREWASGRAVVLKPEFSRFGVFVRLYPDGIEPGERELEPVGDWIAQIFCAGTELCSYSVASAGRLVAHATYQPRYRLGRSSSFYFDPITVPQIESFVQRFVAKLTFTGQVSFDWIRDVQGNCWVLECNPRATSGLHLFQVQALLPQALSGGPVAMIRPGTKPRMIAAIMTTAGLWHSLRAGGVTEWRRDFARATDVIGMPDDRGPLAGAITDLCSYANQAIRARCSMREAATRDIEWDGDPIPVPA